jgi:hypothetical protein
LTEKEAIYYELLVLRCRRGQREALEEVVRTWEKRLKIEYQLGDLSEQVSRLSPKESSDEHRKG